MTIESKGDLLGMRAIGRLVAAALQEMKVAVHPGMTTGELDEIGASFLRRRGARSAPQLTYNFPGFSCISVNDEIVHGVPGSRRIVGGDVVKIDVTAELHGLIADSAATVLVPPVSPSARSLARCARSAFERALSRATADLKISELGRTVENEVTRWGHSVVRDMTGHGVGRALHEEPAVPNFYSPFIPGRLRDGMVIALEPIISERPTAIVEDDDGWTMRTANGCLAAHHEHTIVIRHGRAEVLTLAA